MRCHLFSAGCALAAAVLILSGCGSATGIYPERARILHRVDFPSSRQITLAHFPDGGFALQRFDQDGIIRLEGYDDTLGLLWSHSRLNDTNRTPLWFGHHSGKLVSVWKDLDLPYDPKNLNSWQVHDCTAVWAYSFDRHSGALLDSLRLQGRGEDGEVDFRHRIDPRILTTPDSTLLVSYSVDAPRVLQYDSVQVRARLFDASMQLRGECAFISPIQRTHYIGWHLRGNQVLDSLGNLYFAIGTGPKTVRVVRMNIATCSTTILDIHAPPKRPAFLMNRVIIQPGESGKVMVSVAESSDGKTVAMTLYQLDFRSGAVDFARLIDFTEELYPRADAKNVSPWLWPSKIFTSKSHGSIILCKDLGGDVVLFRIDTSGANRWTAIQDHDVSALQPEAGFVEDIWRLDGDSLHYITRNVLAGTIDLRDGSMSTPQQLLSTDLDVNYRAARWLDPRIALLLLRKGVYNSVVAIQY